MGRIPKDIQIKQARRGHPRFFELTKLMEDTHELKNQNYANDKDPLSNLRDSLELGIDPFLGCMIRMSDKWSRLKQLASGKPDVVGESIADTLVDLASYSLIAAILWEEKND